MEPATSSTDFTGGAITLDSAVISFNGVNNFINNSAGYSGGGAIFTLEDY